MDGRSLRLEKLFGRQGPAVIVAVDHGMFDGLVPGFADLPSVVQKTVSRDADGLLVSPGMFPHVAGSLAYRGAPIGIIRLNWNTVYSFHWAHEDAASVRVMHPSEALAMGAEWVLVSLTLQTGSEDRDARNVEVFASLVSEAHRVGLPAIGEYFPKTDGLETAELEDAVATGARIVAELGADAIKTFWTPSFAEVTRSVPVPVLGLGAEKTPHEVDALALARRIIDDGGRGVVFGRNVIQAGDPAAFLAALCDVVKHGATAADAAARHGLGEVPVR